MKTEFNASGSNVFGGWRFWALVGVFCGLGVAGYFFFGEDERGAARNAGEVGGAVDASGVGRSGEVSPRDLDDGKGAQDGGVAGAGGVGAGGVGKAGSVAGSVRLQPLVRTGEGRIAPEGLGDFQRVGFANGEPAFEGEKITAYVAVGSTGRRVALTVNQLGEFPRVDAGASEPVEVRLAFSSSKPGDRVAVAAQDGGRIGEGKEGKVAAVLEVDEARQVAFAFTTSPNPGMHRVSVTTAVGERHTMEFWVGPPPVLMQAGGLEKGAGRGGSP